MQTINLEGRIYALGYKVVTQDLKSLGLRRNPNIIQYPINQWFYLPNAEIQKGKNDWGGIWVASNISNAKKLKDYMNEKHNVNVRIFKSAIDKILYANSYRVKTNGICLFEEIIS